MAAGERVARGDVAHGDVQPAEHLLAFELGELLVQRRAAQHAQPEGLVRRHRPLGELDEVEEVGGLDRALVDLCRAGLRETGQQGGRQQVAAGGEELGGPRLHWKVPVSSIQAERRRPVGGSL